MEQPVLRVKPSIINAVIPIMASNLLRSLIITFCAWIVILFLRAIETIIMSAAEVWIAVIAIFVVILILPAMVTIIKLINTEYDLYASHITSQFKFINIHKKTVPYTHIVNIDTKINLWDRICNAGNITIHTAEDTAPELKLRYVNNAEKIEEKLHELIEKHKTETQRPTKAPKSL